MFRARMTFRLTALLALLVLPSTGNVAIAHTPAQSQDQVTVEWLGHMFFRFTDPNGTVVLTSPWLDPEGNRDVPISLEHLERADILLVPNSHGDDLGNPTEISARTGARVILPRGLSAWQVGLGMDPGVVISAEVGDVVEIDGVRITVVENLHGNSFRIGDASVDGGPAHGYMVTFTNGFTLYFAASSSINPAMADYGRDFRPHVALINGRPDLVGITELLKTANPNLHTVIPIHIRFGDERVEGLRAGVEALGLGVRLLHPNIGEPLFF